MKFLPYTGGLLLVLSVLTITAAAQTTFTNSASINIADGTDTSVGIGDPYPSTINVGGLNGTVTDVNVRINGLSHSYVSDVALLLVAPGGKSMIIQSDAGGNGNLSDVTYTLDDQAAAGLPELTGFGAGSYKPTSFGDDDFFPVTGSNPPPGNCIDSPCPQAAPAGNATLNGTFGGVNPNGVWRLYAIDYAPDDTGKINGGWTLSITTTGGSGAAANASVDMNGDGRTDFVVTRETTTPLTESWGSDFTKENRRPKSYRERLQMRKSSYSNAPGVDLPRYWYVALNGTGAVSVRQFGMTNDVETPEDFDGDGKDDIAVWRPGAPDRAAFYILQSSNGAVRTELFGQDGDDPTVVGDYDGDKRADVATFRCPQGAAAQCYFYYRGSLNNPARNITFIPFGNGVIGDFYVNPGDFDGDGKYDFCFQRTVSVERGQFILLKSSNFQVEYIDWGLSSDVIVPGDFDGDRKSDFMVVRPIRGQLHWFLLTRTGGGTGANAIIWGLPDDYPTPGDYDGDGKTDVAVWRPNTDPTKNFYYILRSSDSTFQSAEWGMDSDYPVQNWNVH
ncbi:MAG TPA: FG-GAP-like repeat-containing protein [Pyrinomonadaceae bacterium]|nr:FG-GAP-like repeat-containing protein [Pyrinomonadaceae bacterium]